MSFDEDLLLNILITFFFGFIFYNFKILKDRKKLYSHKSFLSPYLKPVFAGGIIIFINLLFLLELKFINYFIFLFFILIIGLSSDLDILKSPKLRIILQILVIFFLVYNLNLYVHSVRISFIDKILNLQFFKFFFSIICLLILINGTNFMDGVNGLVIGYYLIISLIMINTFNNGEIQYLQFEILKIIFVVLICLYLMNFFEIIYLGDSGSYLISIIIGVFLIEFYNNNRNMSPYYIVNLLWYPAYENLFSIIRKIKNKKSAFSPDNQHFHQLFYLLLKNKIKFNKYLNSLTGLLINLFNLIILILASMNYDNTKYQLYLLVFSVFVYTTIYYKILKLQKT